MAFWKKYVFLQALFLTIVMFLIGMYVGISFEKNQFDKMQGLYTNSEISMMDVVALNNLIDANNISCGVLKKASFDFADKVYSEALLLEDYEKAGKISNNMEGVHTKYDLLRTFLWMSTIKLKEKCKSNFSTVVYLYNYSVTDLNQKAEQSVWSKVVYDLKKSDPENVLLIPISVDKPLVSLDSLKSDLKILHYPVVVINEKQVIYNVDPAQDLKRYLN